jgi:hypothetical protein
MGATMLRNIHTRARVAAILLLSALACLGASASAWAQAPTGDFAEFSACPRFSAGVNLCLLAHIESGEVKVGKLTMAINRPILFQAGIIKEVHPPFGETVVYALGGQTLSATPLSVPGGLLGIVSAEALPRPLRELYREAVATRLAAVTVTTQLVGLPTINKNNLVDAEGTALTLPVRFKLNNPLLGGECYVGSAASPVTLELTTGTTDPPPPARPITGIVGEVFQKDEFNYVYFLRNVFVDNSFSVPRATGCGGVLSPLVDSIIDSKIGLPVLPGQGAVALSGSFIEATTVGVIASEK